MFHPFAEEKKSAQRILVEIAWNLCLEGHEVLLFDFYGCGDSEGEFKAATISRWIEDGRHALTFFRSKSSVNKIVLIGLRLGGFVALQLAKQYGMIEELILLEPVFDPQAYLHRALRQKLVKELHTTGQVMTQRAELFNKLQNEQAIDFDGYEIGSAFYQDALRWQTARDDVKFKGKIHLLSMTSKKSLSREYLDVIKKYGQIGTPITGKICAVPPFWNRLERVDFSLLTSEIMEIARQD